MRCSRHSVNRWRGSRGSQHRGSTRAVTEEFTHGSHFFGAEGQDVELASHEGRAAAGTHTLWKNGYFTITRNTNYNNAVITIAPRLCVEEELGETLKSRRFKIRQFDGDAEPAITYLVLRAWMINRVQHNEWVNRCAARKAFFLNEESKLRVDVKKLGVLGGGTGCAAADGWIREWCPSALV